MPTYQYRCTECGSELEAVQKFTDPALTECPTCTGQLRKVFNAVGVVFKGSGFYRTDSRSADKKAGSSTNGSSSSSGSEGSSTEKKAEPKTEKKAEPKSSGSSGSAGNSGNSGSAGSKQPATSGSSTAS